MSNTAPIDHHDNNLLLAISNYIHDQRITTTTAAAAAATAAIAIVMATAAFAMPNFISRLFRPLSGSTRLGVSGGGGGAAAAVTIPEGAEKATVAAGCFWGVEHLYRKHFGGKGLIDARVGYTGGKVDHPNYKQVCSQTTDHAEALQIVFDPTQTSYRQLLEFFYRMHDPTTANRQGPDAGTQYRSAVFYHSPEQERVAREVTRQAAEQWYGGGSGADAVTTEIVPAGPWWDAEDYHQLYLHKNPAGYECPSHFLRAFPPLK